MKRVITISLNGNAYQLEESGYEAMRAYLDVASTRLKDNPDRDEIISDLEQAIAEKCGRFLGPNKTVVSTTEVERILAEMGPVDSPAADTGPAASPSGSASGGHADGAPKRLYQIKEGAMVSGVCNGFAAYFNVDVTLVRLVFVLLTLLTGGVWILVYLVMMFVIPRASTSEEHAAAHGQPFNASELIERAKKQYEDFRSSHNWRKAQTEWRGRLREQQRRWRHQQREWRRRWRDSWDWEGRSYWRAPVDRPPPSYATRVIAGFMIPVFAILSAALFVIWLVMLISLASTGSILGWHLPHDVPVWAGILILVLIYTAVSGPLHMARRASLYAASGRPYGWYGFGDGVIRLGFIVLFLWVAYHFVPGVHELIDRLPDLWQTVTHEATTTAMNWLN